MSKRFVNLTFAVADGVTTQERTQLSPYSYQIFPKSVSALKGNILGSERGISLTAGRGKHYLYFKDGTKVEWMLISPEAHAAIRNGAAVTIDGLEVEEQAAAPAEAPKAKGKKAKQAVAAE